MINFREFIFRYFIQDDVDVLYHYTTQQSGKLILQNQSLWVTNIKYLNDTTEWTYGLDMFKAIINKGNYKSGLVKVIDELLAKFENATKDYFILSLATGKDIIPLWMNYSKLDGFCLGIELSKFNFLLDGMTYNDKNYLIEDIFSYQSGKVIYKEETQKQIILEALKMLNDLFIEHEAIIKTEEFNLISKSILFDFISICALFKDAVFEYESEFRFVIEKGTLLAIKSRSTTYGNTPYIEIDFLVGGDFTTGIPITEIHIGAHNSEENITKFINKKSVYKNPIVRRSKLPLRKPSL